jgi:XTP/dITP diphosphohydrolase
VIDAIKQGNLAEALWQMVALCRREKLNPEVLLRERSKAV